MQGGIIYYIWIDIAKGDVRIQMQGRTHNCGQLRLENAGEKVTLVGWFENIRKVSKNLGFVILRDFYGTTQIVVETEDLMEQFSAINTESTMK